MKKVFIGTMVLGSLLVAGNGLKCSNKSINNIDRTDSKQLLCYFLNAKKDFKTLLSENVLCKGIGFEEYSSMMNYAPAFNMSLLNIEDVGYGLAYHFKINSINKSVLKTYPNSTVIIKNGKIKYKSNGKELDFSNMKTTIGTAKPPKSKSDNLCIWLD